MHLTLLHWAKYTATATMTTTTIPGARQGHAYVTPLAFLAYERNIEKLCLSHTFQYPSIGEQSVKITISKSEPFTFIFFSLPALAVHCFFFATTSVTAAAYH